jgi:opacity protein-like surface antigen
MKTLHKLLITSILFSTLLLAKDKTYSFLGIQTSNQNIEKDSIASVGIKYGKQTKKYRTSLSYSYGATSQNKYETLVAQIDMGILSNSFKNSAFKPYAGISIGAMQNTDKSSGGQDKGYLYGPNAGITYIFNDALDFDLGYRYLKTSKLKDIDSVSDLTLSVHYFY